MKPGSIVECVKGFMCDRHARAFSTTLPQPGVVYTVREVRVNPTKIKIGTIGRNPGVYVLLGEIVNPKVPGFNMEPGFAVEHFREVQFPTDLEAEIQELLTEPILIEA